MQELDNFAKLANQLIIIIVQGQLMQSNFVTDGHSDIFLFFVFKTSEFCQNNKKQ